jgi:hypothetical protein
MKGAESALLRYVTHHSLHFASAMPVLALWPGWCGAAFDIYSAQVLMAGGTCVYVPLRLKDGDAAADGSKQQGEWRGPSHGRIGVVGQVEHQSRVVSRAVLEAVPPRLHSASRLARSSPTLISSRR